MSIQIEPLTRGYLVTHHRDDGSADLYAELSALGALHRAASLLGVEPATLYAVPMPAPELPPDMAALQERQEADDPAVGALKAGEAFESRESGC